MIVVQLVQGSHEVVAAFRGVEYVRRPHPRVLHALEDTARNSRRI